MGLFQVLEQDLENPSKKQTNAHKGLTAQQAQQALQRFGKNELAHQKAVHPIKIFVNQYKDILTVILLISTAVSLVLGEYVEAIAIAVIVLLNGVMGFIQEYKTEKTLESLKKMSAPTARAYRDGKLVTLNAEEIAVGDVIQVKSGDRICADCVILENNTLTADESILTGESQQIAKAVCTEDNGRYELHREDMLYMGTVVTKGHGEARVVCTGMNTQMGAIAGMIHTIEEEPTQLQKKLAQLGKYIAIGCLVVCAVVSAAGILRGEPVMDMLLMGISLAVGAVPEGLPAIVTIVLALAVGRMVKQHALVRRLHAVETLGCTNVICSDKTGTLTQNKMTATELFCGGKTIPLHDSCRFAYGTTAYRLVLCAVLCNNAQLDSRTAYGEPTELGLLQMAQTVHFERSLIAKDYRRLEENPFDSKRKCMSVVVQDMAGQKWLFVKGAIDVLLEKCFYQDQDGNAVLLSYDARQRIIKANERMAGKALRVLALACKPLGQQDSAIENELTFLGLVGMIDPPRPEVTQAVHTCERAGIKTVMITGDHRLTACAIASQIGIYHAGDLVLEGKELETMTAERLEQLVGRVTVFARVSPKHKLMIVHALQKNGNVVAMTGDGVNDAPAVKQADIGVSMGTGTDVTKEASDIILLDDNFATLVSAVREGRVIYANIRKFIRYLLSCNIGEVITMFVGMLMGMPVILLPIQILLVNLVTDGLPAIALGLEPAEPNIMNRKPRKKDDGIFSDGLLAKIVFRGIFIGLTTLAVFVTLFRSSGDVTTARTGAYFTLVVTQFINVFECKSEQGWLLSIHPFSNWKLLGAVGISLMVLLTSIYFPPLQFILNTVSLSYREILTACSFCLIPSITSLILRSKPKQE